MPAASAGPVRLAVVPPMAATVAMAATVEPARWAVPMEREVSAGLPGSGGAGTGGSTGTNGAAGTAGTNPLVFALLAIGNAGNTADHQGGQGDYGTVKYDYSIAKTETTVADYVQFLNAVARYVPDNGQYKYLLNLWNPDMEAAPPSHSVIGSQIIRTGTSGNWTYAAAPGADQLPIANVSWFNAARFVNWLANGQPTYDLVRRRIRAPKPGPTPSTVTALRSSPQRDACAKYWLPSEDEWYKAAYYDPTPPVGSQVLASWVPTAKFATRSDTQPYNGRSPALRTTRMPQTTTRSSSSQGTKLDRRRILHRTALSYYGTQDQAGSLWEWSDTYVENYLRPTELDDRAQWLVEPRNPQPRQ